LQNGLSTRRSWRRFVPATGPTRRSGRKIAALAAGSILNRRKRIRRYWELQAWLVVEAEETMMEEAAGDVEFDEERSAPPLPNA
jgi:hypothetical protein